MTLLLLFDLKQLFSHLKSEKEKWFKFLMIYETCSGGFNRSTLRTRVRVQPTARFTDRIWVQIVCTWYCSTCYVHQVMEHCLHRTQIQYDSRNLDEKKMWNPGVVISTVVSAAATGALVATPDDEHCEAGVIGHRP